MEARFAALELRAAAAPGAAPAPARSAAAIAAASSAPNLSTPRRAAPRHRPRVRSRPHRRRPPNRSTARAAAAPRPSPRVVSFEEKFGTRWTVWIGGVALALGGIFLVKYSIEAGLIGPGLRLFFGALLAAALVVGGEWTRRQKQLAGFAAIPAADIPSILTAAGTTVAYATVYAAYGLYGFLDPAFAFVLLGAVALATLGAALLHGPALAALGLVGAYVTPLLVASTAPNYWALYIYLAVVTAAAFALALARLWQWLALIAVAFGFFWLLPGIHDSGVDALAAHLFHVVAGYALVGRADRRRPVLWPVVASRERSIRSRSSCFRSTSFGALLLVLASRHDPAALTIFTLLTAATVAIAWRTDAAAGAVPVAAVLASVVIVRWALAPEIAQLIAGPGVAGAAAPQPWHADIGPHIALGFLLRRAVRRRGLSGAGPLAIAAHSDPVERGRDRDAAPDPGRALLSHRGLRAFDPVRGAGAAARRAQRLCHRDARQARAAPRHRRLRRALRHRHGRGAGARADLRAGKGLAHGRARADGAGHRLDRQRAPVADAALARRRRGRAGAGAGRLGAAHRRQRRRHHADLQLDPLRLRRARDLVLGRRPSAAQARRRPAVRAWSTAPRSCSRC